MARSLGAHYTSQLNITLTPDIAGETIMCAYHAFTTDPAIMTCFSATVPDKPRPDPLTMLMFIVRMHFHEINFRCCHRL